MSGPLPTGTARRRNAPTIPTTNLPAAGRKGSTPKCPYQLRSAGSTWWCWAWRTPQAAAWSPGDHYVIARRAQLEDDVEALTEIRGLDFDLLGEDGAATAAVVRRVAALATGKLALTKEMRELDDRLGLTPKGMAALRWKITEAAEPKATPAPTQPQRPRLVAVDPTAAAG